MAGLKEMKKNATDGKSLVPVMAGEEDGHEVMFWHYPHYHYGSGMKPASAMRKGDYKLIEWYEQELSGKPGALELYNLADDIGEQKNLVDEKPELAAQMLKELNRWKKQVGAQILTLK